MNKFIKIEQLVGKRRSFGQKLSKIEEIYNFFC